MVDPKKIQKLIDAIEKFSSRLEAEKSLVVHRKLSQFYYMQKAEELRILLEQFTEAECKLILITERIQFEYVSVFRQWRSDSRWLASCPSKNIKSIL